MFTVYVLKYKRNSKPHLRVFFFFLRLNPRTQRTLCNLNADSHLVGFHDTKTRIRKLMTGRDYKGLGCF